MTESERAEPEADARHMARALALAERGRFTADPNPRVGCVLVRDGAVVGEGWHRRAGGPHAEVEALAAAGERARGATAYVTLEPCCHQGRTGPCTRRLAEAGVREVVIAVRDPNPSVAGRGVAELRGAGIGVREGPLADRARALNEGFFSRMLRGRPLVRCKLAMSLDGRTAMASGESRWITGEAARADVQRLRAQSSAVLTGIGTVLADDPALTVRIPQAEGRRPRRVVLDPGARLPAGARLLAEPGPVLVATASAPPARWPVRARPELEVLVAPGAEGRVDLAAVLAHLAGAEANEVLVEAGPTLAGAFVRAGLADELVIYVAPVLMGDAARPLLRLPGLERMSERVRLDVVDLQAFGEDWRIVARPRSRAPTTAAGPPTASETCSPAS